LVPVFAAELRGLVEQAPDLQRQVHRLLDTGHVPFVRNLPVPARDAIEHVPTLVGQKLQTFVNADMGDPLTLLMTAFSAAALFIAIPVTSVYMLLEAAPLKRFVLALLPPPGRATADRVLSKMDRVLGGYIRGQVLVALTIGTMSSAMLALLHVPYAIVIGAWAGVMDVIPYLGAAAGAIPGVLLALVANGLGDAAAVSAGFALIFELEGNLIAPKIVSRTVGVSPLTVIFAVIMGGELFGITGMFVAVPIAGMLRVVIETLRPPGLTEPPHLPEEQRAPASSEPEGQMIW
jgi:predicted PurR-regulated permease PerM